PAAIKLSSIHQARLLIEEKKIRRANGAIRSRHFLALVVKIRERIAGGHNLLRHFLGPVLRKRFYVVGTDRHNARTARLVFPGQRRERRLNVFYVGAVIAKKDDEQSGRPGNVTGGNYL